MKILGIDYGRKKVGLSMSESSIAEPLKVIRVDSFDDAIRKIKSVISDVSAKKVIVGVSEGEMGKESKRFAQEIGAETFDETLTSYDAQKLSIESGMNRKKRKGMEDAFAATLILQRYLDSLD